LALAANLEEPTHENNGENMEDWDGRERRSIPIHILNHIDERLAEQTRQGSASLAEIKETLKTNAESSKARHGTLVDQITNAIGHQKLLETAFPAMEDGRPDYHGHRHFHHTRKKFEDFKKQLGQNAMMKITEYLGLGLFIWLVYVAWEAILHGPVK